ncbi:uncharacterized protein V6R79_019441 [Siganus canaliculatus]
MNRKRFVFSPGPGSWTRTLVQRRPGIDTQSTDSGDAGTEEPSVVDFTWNRSDRWTLVVPAAVRPDPLPAESKHRASTPGAKRSAWSKTTSSDQRRPAATSGGQQRPVATSGGQRRPAAASSDHDDGTSAFGAKKKVGARLV